MIKGLDIYPEFITGEDERALLDSIERDVEWSYALSRKTKQYGRTFNYDTHRLGPGEPFPVWLSYIRDMVYPESDCCIINHYRGCQGIAFHIDSTAVFDNKIVILSLGVPCDFILSKGEEKHIVKFEPRTLLTMKDDARYLWRHSIPTKRKSGVRISITFRKSIRPT